MNDFLLYLAIQIFITFVLSLIFLKTFANLVVFKDDHFFRQINDPEYPLLSRLKEIDKTAYYHAIHVAYFSDKIARKLGVNYNSTKALGYYHRIGLLKGNETIQNTLLVASANYFPKSLILLMKEYGVKNWDSISKEATIVQISESVVSSIMYLFEKDPDTSLNYEQIVDLIIKKKLQKGEFSKSKLTLEELNFVKKVFTEEKLYYDFLR